MAQGLTLLTIFIYLAAVITGFIGMMTSWEHWQKAGFMLAICAFLSQTITLAAGFHTLLPTGPGMGAYIQLIAWFIMLCGTGAFIYLKNTLPVLFTAPFALILFLASAPSINTALKLPAYLNIAFYIFHIGALFLALGVLCTAFVSGLLFLFVQKRIKTKKTMSGFWKNMPALSLLDKINSLCAISAFPLYTAGLITGFFTSYQISGNTFNGDSKEIISLFIWFLLAMLFHNRIALGWKGRKPALFVIIIFALSLFSVLIVNFYLSTSHSFTGN